MHRQDRGPPAPISIAPPEILSCILDLLSDRDFYAAMNAHRIFWVASDHAAKRRRERRWLRTSPERACAARRADVIEFLWRRKRIPRTFDMWRAALAAGDPALMRIALEQDSSQDKLDQVRDKLMKEDARDMFLSVVERFADPIDKMVDRAIELRAMNIFISLLDTVACIRPRRWAYTAAVSGNANALRILFDRYPWIPLGSIGRAATTSHNTNPVGVLSIIHQRDPLFSWQPVLLWAARRNSADAIKYVCCQLAPPALDLEAAFVEAAKHGQSRAAYLLGQWPVPLQAAVDASDECGGNAGLEAVMRVHIGRMTSAPLCQSEPRLDLQRVLERASERDQLERVSFIVHNMGAPVDLDGALAVAQSPRMAEFIADAIASRQV